MCVCVCVCVRVRVLANLSLALIFNISKYRWVVACPLAKYDALTVELCAANLQFLGSNQIYTYICYTLP